MDNSLQIGKVNIDLSKYSGQDFYSEGEIEDKLLEVAETVDRSEFRKIIENNTSWPYLYHFSKVRENIVSWLPIKPSDKVLEVGAGMGAVTNALCQKAGSVTSVDLSLKRSKVNANRNKDMDNLTIKVGNFTDIEEELDKYDWIMLIGVFEYAISYMGTDNPFEDFLKILMKHLKPEGRLVIAIENRLGMKYFAGCKEDHTCGFFDGIENYHKGGQVRTFSRAGLEKIFEKVDITNYHFYYPYPDYKLPNTIFSDKRLPLMGELRDNLRNFDQDRIVLFDETNAYDGMIEEGLFATFSNSYEVVIGPDVETEYAKYSMDRDDKYCISTIISNIDGKRIVRKAAVSKEGAEHIKNINKAHHELNERFHFSELSINKVLEYDEENAYIDFEYIEGDTLEKLLDEKVRNKDKEGFIALFEKFKSLVHYNDDYPVYDSDMIFSNIIVKDEEWTLIDYEWTNFTKGSAHEIVYRAINNYLLPGNERMIIKEWVDAENEFDENLFQQRIIGNNKVMSTIRHEIGKGVYSLDYITDRVVGLNMRVQIYEDFGNGFSEENSYFTEYKKNGPNVCVEAKCKENLKALRIDPGDKPARIYVNQVTLNDIIITDKVIGSLKNGCVNPKNVIQKDNVIVYKKADPHFKINLKGMSLKKDDILKIDMRVEYIY